MINIDKNYLKKVLDFSEVHSIEEVVGKMEVTLDYFYSSPELNHLIPFLKTYQFVTKEVTLRSIGKDHSYIHKKGVEKLDIEFGRLYYLALGDYLLRDKLTTPWKSYFEFCRSGKNLPFLQVLLGINAHINGDLVLALTNSNFKSVHDFYLVDEVLKDVLPGLMKYLAIEEKDFFGMAGMLMDDLFEREMELIIVKWRDLAFKNYRKFLKSNNKLEDLENIYRKTELIAENIIHLFGELYTFHNPFHVIDKLNRLELKI